MGRKPLFLAGKEKLFRYSIQEGGARKQGRRRAQARQAPRPAAPHTTGLMLLVKSPIGTSPITTFSSSRK